MSTYPHSQPATLRPTSLAAARPRSHVTLRGLLDWLMPTLVFPLLLLAAITMPFSMVKILDNRYLVSDVVMAGATVLLLTLVVSGRQRVWLPWWLGASALLFFLSFTFRAMSLGAIERPDLLNTAYLAFSIYVIPLCVASQYRAREGQVRLLLWIWVAATLVGGIVGILQHLKIGVPFLQQFMPKYYGARIPGATEHPNRLGFFMDLVTPLCLAVALSARRGWLTLAGLAACALCFYVINLTGSRSCLVVAFAGCVVVGGISALYRNPGVRLSRQLRLVFIALLAAAALQTVSSGPQSAIARLLEGSPTAEASDIERAFHQARSAERFWQEMWSGQGNQFYLQAHTFWLGLLECGGVLELAALLLYAAGLSGYALRLGRMGIRGERDFALALGLAVIVFMWLLYGIKEIPIGYRNLHFAFGLLVLYCIRNEQGHTA
jgi:hypothetical protein